MIPEGATEASHKTFDQAVLKTLAGLVKSCLGPTQDFAKLAGDRHKACEGVLEQMEAILKKNGKAVDVSDMKVLETTARSVKNHSVTLGEISGDMFKALTQFSGGWPATYRPLLSTPAAL